MIKINTNRYNDVDYDYIGLSINNENIYITQDDGTFGESCSVSIHRADLDNLIAELIKIKKEPV